MEWQSLEIEQFEDIKAVIRIRKPKKDRQHNGQKKKDKRANNDLQSITHNIKDPVSRIPLKTGGELRCSGRVGSSCSTSLLNLPKWSLDAYCFSLLSYLFPYFFLHLPKSWCVQVSESFYNSKWLPLPWKQILEK